jgi:hypothetical protein
MPLAGINARAAAAAVLLCAIFNAARRHQRERMAWRGIIHFPVILFAFSGATAQLFALHPN